MTMASKVCGILIGATLIVPGAVEPNPGKPGARWGEEAADKLLDSFAAEFVALDPGMGKFPKPLKRHGKETAMQPFRIAKYEVPQNLYQAVAGRNQSRWRGPRNAVENVNYDEAVGFCETVTKRLRDRKMIEEQDEIRLPTVAEWEYACRAGTTTAYSFGEESSALGDYAWFHSNAAGNDPPVGAKKPNSWGLYDMHGYLWEWCLAEPTNDRGEATVCGGAWTTNADQCRSDSRLTLKRNLRREDVGFRCVWAKKPKATGDKKP